MKIILLKDIPRPPKNPYKAGLIREVTKEKGAEEISTGLWEEYTGQPTVDNDQPRSKSNPKKTDKE